MTMIKHTVADIRRKNRLAVLRHIYAMEAANRQLLTVHSGLSAATVANVVTDLIEARIVVESGLEQSRGGRPRAILAVNARHGYLVGVDIAETYVHFELFDLGLALIHAVEHRLDPAENQPSQVVKHLVGGLAELLRSADVPHTAVLGVGVSVPGLVDPSGGASVFAPNWGWHDVPLLKLLRAQIDLPLYLENPLKAIAVSQLWFGTGRNANSVIVLNIGTGVGAGIIIGGELYRGVVNGAGEWGHMTVALDGRQCRCGSMGCIESYVGTPGIIQHLRELAPESPLLAFGDQTAIIDALATAVSQGDPAALATIRRTARYLGAGVANLVNLFNPEVIVIGGWAGRRLGPHLLPELLPVVMRYAFTQSVAATRIELCSLRHNPVSMGAATFALEGYLAAIDKGSVLMRA
jgi:predicted NBD/HSP70 family sugar kinase